MLHSEYRDFLQQAEADNVARQTQQVCRGDRDGFPTECFRFFYPRDSNSIRNYMNKAKIVERAAPKMLSIIRERSTFTTTAFLHRSDFTASGIDDHQNNGALVAVTGMRVHPLGQLSLATFMVLLGSLSDVLSDTPI